MYMYAYIYTYSLIVFYDLLVHRFYIQNLVMFKPTFTC